MRFAALLLSLWQVAAAGQPAGSAGLPAPLRDVVKSGRFGIVTSVRGLPLGVREELQTMFRSPTLDIADPGAPFHGPGAPSDPTLPTRRLVAAGCTAEYCLVHYERGGNTRTWHVALFHWRPAATRLEWGGTAPRGLATLDDVRNAVLAGIVKSPAESW